MKRAAWAIIAVMMAVNSEVFSWIVLFTVVVLAFAKCFKMEVEHHD